MSKLDQLRNQSVNEETVIDMTAGLDGTNNKPVNNNSVKSKLQMQQQMQPRTNKYKNKMNLQGQHYENEAAQQEEVIDMMADPVQPVPAAPESTGQRKAINIASMGGSEERVSRSERRRNGESSIDGDAVARSILVGEDSIFEKWKKEKHQEYAERMAEFDLERQKLIEEGKLKPEDIKDDIATVYTSDEDGEAVSEVTGKIHRDDDLVFDDDEQPKGEEATMERKETDLIPAEFEQENELVQEYLKEELTESSIEAEPKEENLLGDLEEAPAEEFEEVYHEPAPQVYQSADIVSVKKKEQSKSDSNKKEDEEEDKSVSGEGIVLEFSSANAFKEESVEEENPTANVADNDTMDRLKVLANEKLGKSLRKIDINNFQIMSKKASNISKKKIIDSSDLRVVKWVLPIQKQVVFMRQYTGLELQRLSEDIQENTASSIRRAYRSVYDHIMSAGKPKTFTQWLRCTPEADFDHYFFAIFIASYKGTNYLPMTCPNRDCTDRTFLTDDIDIMKMVKFPDEEKKKEFMEIYKSETVFDNTDAKYIVARTQVTDDLAIDFKEPMLIDSLNKQAIAGDTRFMNKNQVTFDIIQYVDTLFEIDYENQGLLEIEYEQNVNDVTQYRNKISEYNRILNTLTSDQFSLIRAVTNEIRDRDNTLEPMMKYVVPAMTCPNCGTEVPEEEANPVQLVFTRYQLGALVNTSLS